MYKGKVLFQMIADYSPDIMYVTYLFLRSIAVDFLDLVRTLVRPM